MTQAQQPSSNAKSKSGVTQVLASTRVAPLRDATTALRAEGKNDQAFDILLGVIESLAQDNDRMTWRLRAAVVAAYGRRTERLTAEELGQLVLALGGTEEQAALAEPDVPIPNAEAEQGDAGQGELPNKPAQKKKRPRHKGRVQLSSDLPRDITTVAVPADERNCIHCHEPMQVIDHVDSERIEFIPASFRVRVERREKLACKEKDCGQDITSAPRRDSRAYQRRAGVSLLAYMLESKCDDALPIYRQQEQFQRLGCDIPLNTLYGYWAHAAELLEPVGDAILSSVLAEKIIAVDDTRLDYLTPEGPRGKQRGHLWCFVGTSKLVAFSFTKTWTAEDVAPWLNSIDIDAFIQCDDYKGYGATLKHDDGSEYILVPPERRLGCMMHVRRKFHAAFKGGHLEAAVPIRFIADIYKIERLAKDDNLGPPQRLALRQEKSIPLLDDFEGWVDDSIKTLLPSNPVAMAARYAKDQRPYVRRCFSDGRFEIDNGRVERELREPAIGRKNYLFAGSAAAARRLAHSYSVVLSARKCGLPVREYLVDILSKLERGWPLKRLTELLPQNWVPTASPEGHAERVSE